MAEQRGAPLREIERLQQHLDDSMTAAYQGVMRHMAAEIGAAMGIDERSAALLFDAIIGDLDDFADVHGISAEQIHAFRGAVRAMLAALKDAGANP